MPHARRPTHQRAEKQAQALPKKAGSKTTSDFPARRSLGEGVATSLRLHIQQTGRFHGVNHPATQAFDDPIQLLPGDGIST